MGEHESCRFDWQGSDLVILFDEIPPAPGSGEPSALAELIARVRAGRVADEDRERSVAALTRLRQLDARRPMAWDRRVRPTGQT